MAQMNNKIDNQEQPVMTQMKTTPKAAFTPRQLATGNSELATSKQLRPFTPKQPKSAELPGNHSNYVNVAACVYAKVYADTYPVLKIYLRMMPWL